ncbi:MAG: hypothetical protein U5K69_12215 [Balneolaceae bacterium]|nr:hypothetical protein [Balneolaceae bacterium]
MATATPLILPNPDSSGQGTGQRLKMVDVAWIVGVVIFTAQHIEGVPEVAEGDKPRVDHEEQPAATQQNDKGCSPHKAGKCR